MKRAMTELMSKFLLGISDVKVAGSANLREKDSCSDTETLMCLENRQE